MISGSVTTISSACASCFNCLSTARLAVPTSISNAVPFAIGSFSVFGDR